MNAIRVCFLGTPEFAAHHLQTLLDDSRFKIVGVVTQPDRPAGRKMQLASSAVKTLALKNNLPVVTPVNLRKESEIFEIIKLWSAEIAVVVAFGQILSNDFLNSFQFGAVNIHGSLLPLWRGAAPIQRSIQNGDTTTGVSLQKMVFKLDAGAVIGERQINLNQQITATELYSELSKLGCELLTTELIDYIHKDLIPQDQDETKVTLAVKISKEESLLKFDKPAIILHNTVRAFTMGPGTYFLFKGQRLKVHKTDFILNDSSVAAGFVSEINDMGISVQTGSGQLVLKLVQLESKNKMTAHEFSKLFQINKGDFFG